MEKINTNSSEECERCQAGGKIRGLVGCNRDSLRSNHLVFEGVSQKFGVGADVERLHHSILVKGDRAWFHVDHICDLLHRHALGEQLQNFTLSPCDPLFFREGLSFIKKKCHCFLGNERRKIRLPSIDLTDREQEFSTGRLLENVTGSASTECFSSYVRGQCHGEEYQFDPGISLFNLLACIESIQTRHVDIEEDDVRP